TARRRARRRCASVRRREAQVNDVRVGAQLAFARLRSASAAVVLTIFALAVFAAAVLERRSDAAAAPDDVLFGIAFGIALPVLAYLVSERVCDGKRLERSVDSVARYGADRRRAVLGLLLASALATALGGAFLVLVAVLGAHTPGAASLAFDLRSSVGIALVSGFAYALCFGAASLLGKRGGGRTWALIADFAFGTGASAFAALWPRSHVKNLLGGTPALDLPQASAWLALIAIGIACLGASFVWTTE
ncbi:MAG TPA: hypothetical protein VF294_00210, partial [Polyangiaceae bacterium]